MVALDFIKSLFKQDINSDELRGHLQTLEREKRELRYDQRKLDRERIEAFERTKSARKRGDQTEVVFHLQELKGYETEKKLLMRDIGRANKALLVLGQYGRRLSRLERRRDTEGLAQFVQRFRTSGAMAQIEQADVGEEMLQEMLDEELEELDRDLGFEGDFGKLDDEMKGLLDAVDAVIEAEESGDEAALHQLKSELRLQETGPLTDDEMLAELEREHGGQSAGKDESEEELRRRL